MLKVGGPLPAILASSTRLDVAWPRMLGFDVLGAVQAVFLQRSAAAGLYLHHGHLQMQHSLVRASRPVWLRTGESLANVDDPVASDWCGKR
ncbi:MAG: hypothetical protein ACR2IK_07910 [Chloroflexota bacterium]